MKNCVSKLFAIKIRDNWFCKFDWLKASLWFFFKKNSLVLSPHPQKKKKKNFLQQNYVPYIKALHFFV